jgi:hypothetical protein
MAIWKEKRKPKQKNTPPLFKNITVFSYPSSCTPGNTRMQSRNLHQDTRKVSKTALSKGLLPHHQPHELKLQQRKDVQTLCSQLLKGCGGNLNSPSCANIHTSLIKIHTSSCPQTFKE